jgi:hypothetical protein
LLPKINATASLTPVRDNNNKDIYKKNFKSFRNSGAYQGDLTSPYNNPLGLAKPLASNVQAAIQAFAAKDKNGGINGEPSRQ